MITSNPDKRRTVGKVLLDSAAAQAFGRVAEWSEVFVKPVALIVCPRIAGFDS